MQPVAGPHSDREAGKELSEGPCQGRRSREATRRGELTEPNLRYLHHHHCPLPAVPVPNPPGERDCTHWSKQRRTLPPFPSSAPGAHLPHPAPLCPPSSPRFTDCVQSDRSPVAARRLPSVAVGGLPGAGGRATGRGIEGENNERGSRAGAPRGAS